jgi:hypothetical protein
VKSAGGAVFNKETFRTGHWLFMAMLAVGFKRFIIPAPNIPPAKLTATNRNTLNDFMIWFF